MAESIVKRIWGENDGFLFSTNTFRTHAFQPDPLWFFVELKQPVTVSSESALQPRLHLKVGAQDVFANLVLEQLPSSNVWLSSLRFEYDLQPGEAGTLSLVGIEVPAGGSVTLSADSTPADLAIGNAGNSANAYVYPAFETVLQGGTVTGSGDNRFITLDNLSQLTSLPADALGGERTGVLITVPGGATDVLSTVRNPANTGQPYIGLDIMNGATLVASVLKQGTGFVVKQAGTDYAVPVGVEDLVFVLVDGTGQLIDSEGVEISLKLRTFVESQRPNDIAIRGTLMSDTINVSDKTAADAVHIRSGAGADTITGHDGFDLIHAGGGTDNVSAAGGDDVIVFTPGNDIVNAGDGLDTVRLFDGVDYSVPVQTSVDASAVLHVKMGSNEATPIYTEAYRISRDATVADKYLIEQVGADGQTVVNSMQVTGAERVDGFNAAPILLKPGALYEGESGMLSGTAWDDTIGYVPGLHFVNGQEGDDTLVYDLGAGVTGLAIEPRQVATGTQYVLVGTVNSTPTDLVTLTDYSAGYYTLSAVGQPTTSLNQIEAIRFVSGTESLDVDLATLGSVQPPPTTPSIVARVWAEGFGFLTSATTALGQSNQPDVLNYRVDLMQAVSVSSEANLQPRLHLKVGANDAYASLVLNQGQTTGSLNYLHFQYALQPGDAGGLSLVGIEVPTGGSVTLAVDGTTAANLAIGDSGISANAYVYPAFETAAPDGTVSGAGDNRFILLDSSNLSVLPTLAAGALGGERTAVGIAVPGGATDVLSTVRNPASGTYLGLDIMNGQTLVASVLKAQDGSFYVQQGTNQFAVPAGVEDLVFALVNNGQFVDADPITLSLKQREFVESQRPNNIAVRGTLMPDTIDVSAKASSERVQILSGAGSDTLTGHDGFDYINAGGGNDTVSAGAGGDVIVFSNGTDTVDAGAGTDTVRLFDGFDFLPTAQISLDASGVLHVKRVQQNGATTTYVEAYRISKDAAVADKYLIEQIGADGQTVINSMQASGVERIDGFIREGLGTTPVVLSEAFEAAPPAGTSLIARIWAEGSGIIPSIATAPFEPDVLDYRVDLTQAVSVSNDVNLQPRLHLKVGADDVFANLVFDQGQTAGSLFHLHFQYALQPGDAGGLSLVGIDVPQGGPVNLVSDGSAANLAIGGNGNSANAYVYGAFETVTSDGTALGTTVTGTGDNRLILLGSSNLSALPLLPEAALGGDRTVVGITVSGAATDVLTTVRNPADTGQPYLGLDIMKGQTLVASVLKAEGGGFVVRQGDVQYAVPVGVEDLAFAVIDSATGKFVDSDPITLSLVERTFVESQRAIDIAVRGTLLPDTIDVSAKASSERVQILSGAGSDTLTGHDGFDYINAGGGNDTVSAGAGGDVIVFSNGTDTVDGGADTDTVRLFGGTLPMAQISLDAGGVLHVKRAQQSGATTTYVEAYRISKDPATADKYLIAQIGADGQSVINSTQASNVERIDGFIREGLGTTPVVLSEAFLAGTPTTGGGASIIARIWAETSGILPSATTAMGQPFDPEVLDYRVDLMQAVSVSNDVNLQPRLHLKVGADDVYANLVFDQGQTAGSLFHLHFQYALQPGDAGGLSLVGIDVPQGGSVNLVADGSAANLAIGGNGNSANAYVYPVFETVQSDGTAPGTTVSGSGDNRLILLDSGNLSALPLLPADALGGDRTAVGIGVQGSATDVLSTVRNPASGTYLGLDIMNGQALVASVLKQGDGYVVRQGSTDFAVPAGVEDLVFALVDSATGQFADSDPVTLSLVQREFVESQRPNDIAIRGTIMPDTIDVSNKSASDWVQIRSGAGSDTLTGHDGRDYINAGGGNDTVSTGAGSDVIVFSNGTDTVDAGTDTDTVRLFVDQLDYLPLAQISLDKAGVLHVKRAQQDGATPTYTEVYRISKVPDVADTYLIQQIGADGQTVINSMQVTGAERIDGFIREGLGTTPVVLSEAFAGPVAPTARLVDTNGDYWSDQLWIDLGQSGLTLGEAGSLVLEVDNRFELEMPASRLSIVGNELRVPLDTGALPPGYIPSFLHAETLGGLLVGATGPIDERLWNWKILSGPAGPSLMEVTIISGTADADTYTGTSGDDWYRGRGGNDTISGGAGNDNLGGNDGSDTIDGGPGNDVLIGGPGDDILKGGDGSGDVAVYPGYRASEVDVIREDDGSLTVIIPDTGEEDHLTGIEILRFDDGPSSVAPSFVAAQYDWQSNVITGTDFDDVIDADAMREDAGATRTRDWINALGGDDTIDAGEGGDDIQGGPGDDVIDGGNDTLAARLDPNVTNIWELENRASYSGPARRYTIEQKTDDDTGSVTGVAGMTYYIVKDLRDGSPDGTDTVFNVDTLQFNDKWVRLTPEIWIDREWDWLNNRPGAVRGVNATGTDFADSLGAITTTLAVSFAGSDRLVGNAGDDVLKGGGGADTLRGDAGNDTLDGGANRPAESTQQWDPQGSNGVDVAEYSGKTERYTIERNTDDETGSVTGVAGMTYYTVTDSKTRGGDGTDTLTTIEVLRFADGEKNLEVIRSPMLQWTWDPQTGQFGTTVTGMNWRGTDWADTIDATVGESTNGLRDDVDAGSGDDIIKTGKGGDYIRPGEGDDTIDGGANGTSGNTWENNDVVFYDAPMRRFAITMSEAANGVRTFTVADKLSAEFGGFGTDTVTNVETLQFSDGAKDLQVVFNASGFRNDIRGTDFADRIDADSLSVAAAGTGAAKVGEAITVSIGGLTLTEGHNYVAVAGTVWTYQQWNGTTYETIQSFSPFWPTTEIALTNTSGTLTGSYIAGQAGDIVFRVYDKTANPGIIDAYTTPHVGDSSVYSVYTVADYIQAGAGHDVVYAGGGGDNMTDGAGNDFYDGGANGTSQYSWENQDSVQFMGAQKRFRVEVLNYSDLAVDDPVKAKIDAKYDSSSRPATVVRVIDKLPALSGGHGVNYLINVERVQFQDGQVELGVTTDLAYSLDDWSSNTLRGGLLNDTLDGDAFIAASTTPRTTSKSVLINWETGQTMHALSAQDFLTTGQLNSVTFTSTSLTDPNVVLAHNHVELSPTDLPLTIAAANLGEYQLHWVGQGTPFSTSIQVDVAGFTYRDWMEGGPGNDRLLGGEGADQLAGGKGNDFIDGGNNPALDPLNPWNTWNKFDEARFTNSIKRYDITFYRSATTGETATHDANGLTAGTLAYVRSDYYDPNGFIVVRDRYSEALGGEGRDVVKNVETLVFSDAWEQLRPNYSDYPSFVSIWNPDTGQYETQQITTRNVWGSRFGDRIEGLSNGQNTLQGNAGNDLIVGGALKDELTGGPGNDVIDGRANPAVNPAEPWNTWDKYDVARFDAARTEFDIQRLTDTSGSITGTANQVYYQVQHLIPARLGGLGTDIVFNIERLQFSDGDEQLEVKIIQQGNVTRYDGSNFGDTITGTSDNDDFSGRGGNDTINGGAGNDQIWLGLGNDTADGGAGADRVIYDDGHNRFTVTNSGNGAWTVVDTLAAQYGGEGTDTLTNVETLQFDDGTWATGGSFVSSGVVENNDTVNGSSYQNSFGSANYTVTLEDLAGNLLATYDTAQRKFLDGTTEVVFDTNLHQVVATDKTWGYRYFYPNAESVAFDGTNIQINVGYNDYLQGYGGNDTINGLSGDDTLNGGAGNDILNGGLDSTNSRNTYWSAGDVAQYQTAPSTRFDIINNGDGTYTVADLASLKTIAFGSDGHLTAAALDASNVWGDVGFGVDRLSGIERLQFSDVTLDLVPIDNSWTWQSYDYSTQQYYNVTRHFITGTFQDDVLRGSVFGDQIDGRGGDDIINGGVENLTTGNVWEIQDVINYTGARARYEIKAVLVDITGDGNNRADYTIVDADQADGNEVLGIQITDTLPDAAGGTGTDLLVNVERVQFAWSGSGDDSSISITPEVSEYNDWSAVLTRDENGNPLTYGQSVNARGTIFDDVLAGKEYSDWLSGNDGNDTLIGGGGGDELEGGKGDDVIIGGANAAADQWGWVRTDTARFNAPFDRFTIETVTIDGEAWLRVADSLPSDDADSLGSDLLSGVESLSFNDRWIDVAVRTNSWTDWQGVKTVNHEGTVFGDVMVGSTTTTGDVTVEDRDSMRGNAGDDILKGNGNGDELDGGEGNDVLDGGANGTSGDAWRDQDSARFNGDASRYEIKTFSVTGDSASGQFVLGDTAVATVTNGVLAFTDGLDQVFTESIDVADVQSVIERAHANLDLFDGAHTTGRLVADTLASDLGGDGSDLVFNVESLWFANGPLELDLRANANDWDGDGKLDWVSIMGTSGADEVSLTRIAELTGKTEEQLTQTRIDIELREGDDVYLGGSGGESVRTGPGDDYVDGGANTGTDQWGGAMRDEVHFQGKFSRYTLIDVTLNEAGGVWTVLSARDATLSYSVTDGVSAVTSTDAGILKLDSAGLAQAFDTMIANAQAATTQIKGWLVADRLPSEFEGTGVDAIVNVEAISFSDRWMPLDVQVYYQRQWDPAHPETPWNELPISSAYVDGTQIGDVIGYSASAPEGTYNYAGDDTLRGNEGDDVINGGAGGDWIHGGAGDDAIDGGGNGVDQWGNPRIDTAQYDGEFERYTITANDDGSVTVADSDPDGDGADTLLNVEAVSFRDRYLRLGIETWVNRDFYDPSKIWDVSVNGSLLSDTIDVSEDAYPGIRHFIHGNEGDDTLIGGSGPDDLVGGAGDDTLVGGDNGKDFWGNPGFDTARYDGLVERYTIEYSSDGGENWSETNPGGSDLLVRVTDSWSAEDGGLGADILSGIEALSFWDRFIMLEATKNVSDLDGDGRPDISQMIGTDSADTLTGDATNDYLDGGGGNDTLAGGLGGDILLGGAGDDVIDGGEDGVDREGNVLIDIAEYAGERDDYTVTKNEDGSFTVSSTEEGTDTLTGIEGLQFSDGFLILAEKREEHDQDGDGVVDEIEIRGTDALGDTIAPDADKTGIRYRIAGGDGDDSLTGGTGNDRFEGGPGNDTIDGGQGDDDRARFSGNSSDYTFTTVGATTTVTHNNGGADGTDTLTGIERLVFADKVVWVDSEAAAVTSLKVDTTGNKKADTQYVTGTDSADTVTGEADLVNIVKTGVGNDTIIGGRLGDEFYPGAGNDTIDGGANDGLDAGGNPMKDRVFYDGNKSDYTVKTIQKAVFSLSGAVEVGDVFTVTIGADKIIYAATGTTMESVATGLENALNAKGLTGIEMDSVVNNGVASFTVTGTDKMVAVMPAVANGTHAVSSSFTVNGGNQSGTSLTLDSVTGLAAGMYIAYSVTTGSGSSATTTNYGPYKISSISGKTLTLAESMGASPADDTSLTVTEDNADTSGASSGVDYDRWFEVSKSGETDVLRDIEELVFRDGAMSLGFTKSEKAQWGDSGLETVVKVTGTELADIIRASTATEILSGGDGDDKFVFPDGNGKDQIRGFRASGSGDVLTFVLGPNDTDGINGTGVDTVTELMARMSQQGNDTVIDLGGGNVITLVGVAVDELHAANFEILPAF